MRTNPIYLALAIVLASLTTTSSHAATWVDPSFEDAVKLAELIAVVETTGAKGSAGPHSLRVKVIERVAGPATANEFDLVGHYDPERAEPPDLVAGRRFLALLERRGEAYGALTPSYGLFPITESTVLGSVRDTSVRGRFVLSDWLGLIKALKLGKAPEPRLTAWREAADGAGLIALDETAACRLILALEGLARFGGAEDEARARRLLGSELLQVRIASLRLLGRCASPSAMDLLVERVETSPPGMEAAWAALSLQLVGTIPESLKPRLLSLCEKASLVDVGLGDGVEDPRRNRLPAPRIVLLRLCGSLRWTEVLPAAERAIASRDIDWVKAGLAALLRFDDETRIPRILAAMRPADAEDAALLNRYFASALEQASGQKLGRDKSQWVSWWEKEQSARKSETQTPKND